MTNIVPAEDIEALVGAARHPTLHQARVDTQDTEQVYILHSQKCIDRYGLRPDDIRSCPFSKALDNGIEDYEWADHYDQPVVVTVMYDMFDGGRPRLAPDLAQTP